MCGTLSKAFFIVYRGGQFFFFVLNSSHFIYLLIADLYICTFLFYTFFEHSVGESWYSVKNVLVLAAIMEVRILNIVGRQVIGLQFFLGLLSRSF